MAKQISVFLENAPGRLNHLLKILSDNNINITSLAIADTGEYGITRLIVSEHDKAIALLKESGMSVSETEVLAIALNNTSGQLYNATKLLSDNGINVEYAYSALPDSNDKAIVVLRVDYIQEALKVINEANSIELIEIV